MVGKASLLTLACTSVSAYQINRAHLQLKLQALEKETHCMVEHATVYGWDKNISLKYDQWSTFYKEFLFQTSVPFAKLNGDVYPKRLCLRQKYDKNIIIEDDYESNPEYAQRVWVKNPNEKYNDCFCQEGYVELASTGQCIKIEDCATEYRMNCPAGEEYGLYISEEPYCRANLDLDNLKHNPDIFDELMESVLGAGGVAMNWMEIFSPSQLNSIFDDACNEIDSPIKQHCQWKLLTSGFSDVYNSIDSNHQFQVRKLVLKSSFLGGSNRHSNLAETTLKRGCHCKQGYGRMRDSKQKYIMYRVD